MRSDCPEKERCGSCGWSHIPYEKQLAQKLADINGSFALKELNYHCDEILPSPRTAHYRNRMDFVIDFEGRVGLREKGKWWRVIDNHPCFISDEKIEALFSSVRSWVQSSQLTYFDRKKHTGLLRYAVIRSSLIGESMVTIVTSKPQDNAESEVIKAKLHELAQLASPTTLLWGINSTITDTSWADSLKPISGPGVIYEEICGFRYVITPNAFFQTNSHAAPLLLDTVREFAGDLSGQSLLDLYCGSGFFSIALASKTAKTVGVELSAEAIRDARLNAEANGVSVQYFDAKAEEFNWREYGADLIILDPPRSGMHDKALSEVIATKPKRIVFVSCNYKHFAHAMLALGEHYNLGRMRAIDMFPHTPHVELVAELTRSTL